MKSRWVIILLMFAISGFSQEPTFVFEDTVNDQAQVKFISYNSYSSNRFSNEFMDKFIFGGDISTELKTQMANRLKGANVFGGEMEQRIDSYSPDIHLFKKEDYGMKLSFSDNHYFSANITEDLFNTALFGNSNYIGDTMDFTFSSVQYQHYQKFSLGFYHKSNLSSIQLSYISGSKTLKGALNESWMYSRPELDTIDVFLSGDAFFTDRMFPYWAFQGSGFSIDIDYNFIFEGKTKNKQIINFRINNLGMIFWNKNSLSYTGMAQRSYSGFNIQDLLDDDTTDFDIDWLDTMGVNQNMGRQVDVLPFELVVQKLADRQSTNSLQAIFGFKAIMVPNYFPYLYVGGYYQPIKDFSVSTRLSYGGFAGLRWGINVNYWLKDNFYFGLGSFDVIGLASKKIGRGRGFNFSMYYRL